MFSTGGTIDVCDLVIKYFNLICTRIFYNNFLYATRFRLRFVMFAFVSYIYNYVGPPMCRKKGLIISDNGENVGKCSEYKKTKSIFFEFPICLNNCSNIHQIYLTNIFLDFNYLVYISFHRGFRVLNFNIYFNIYISQIWP